MVSSPALLSPAPISPLGIHHTVRVGFSGVAWISETLCRNSLLGSPLDATVSAYAPGDESAIPPGTILYEVRKELCQPATIPPNLSSTRIPSQGSP